MKKLFTLILLAAAGIGTLAAQSVVVTCDGKEVKKGDVLTFYVEDDSDPYDIIAGPPLDPTFTSADGSQVYLSVTVTPDAKSRDGKLQWCGMSNGNCFNLTEAKTLSTNLTTLPTYMQLEAKFDEGKYATYTATVTVKANGSVINAFTEKFVYDKEHIAGINTAQTQKNSVKLQGNTLRYAFDGTGTRTLQVYSLDGKLVKSIATTGQGTLSLQELGRGVYLYNVKEGERSVEARKVVLK